MNLHDYYFFFFKHLEFTFLVIFTIISNDFYRKLIKDFYNNKVQLKCKIVILHIFKKNVKFKLGIINF